MHRREQFLITVSGPESCGKSTLAEQLASRLGWGRVGEYARQALTDGYRYSGADVVRIGLVQHRQIQEALRSGGSVLADTDLLTIRIWLEERFGTCPEWIRHLHRSQRPDFCLLCAPDLPWEPDPLRENPHDRERLMERHLQLLTELRIPFHIVTGIGESRTQGALDALRRSS